MIKKTINGHTLTFEHEDKMYFPRSGITKKDLLDYYARIAPRMLPFCKDRPLVMHRYPNGINETAFFQKNASDYFPSWIKEKKIAKKTGEGSSSYVVCQNKATLLYLVNQACITPHLWLSKINALNYPDIMLFDLDPAGEKMGKKISFAPIVDTAHAIKERLKADGLTSWVMTTGSRGLHVRVPLKPVHTFDQVRAYAFSVARDVMHDSPKHITVEARKEKRGNRLLIDVMRNGFGATGVAPYGVRALEGAPIATPIAWEELQIKNFNAQFYTLTSIFAALKGRKNPWQGIQRYKQALRQAPSHR